MWVGLIAGIFLGGLGLLLFGTRAIVMGPDCAALTPEECAFERETLRSLGRYQVLAGGALALMGLSLFVYFRRRGEGSEEK